MYAKFKILWLCFLVFAHANIQPCTLESVTIDVETLSMLASNPRCVKNTALLPQTLSDNQCDSLQEKKCLIVFLTHLSYTRNIIDLVHGLSIADEYDVVLVFGETDQTTLTLTSSVNNVKFWKSGSDSMKCVTFSQVEYFPIQQLLLQQSEWTNLKSAQAIATQLLDPLVKQEAPCPSTAVLRVVGYLSDSAQTLIKSYFNVLRLELQQDTDDETEIPRVILAGAPMTVDQAVRIRVQFSRSVLLVTDHSRTHGVEHETTALLQLLGHQLFVWYSFRPDILPSSQEKKLDDLVWNVLEKQKKMCMKWWNAHVPLPVALSQRSFCQFFVPKPPVPETSVDMGAVLPFWPARTPLSTIADVFSTCVGDELLYNGICLPRQWPPTYSLNSFAKFITQPPYVLEWYDLRTPPYLEQPPDVVPVHVGRQLFIDDFLISTFCSFGWTRNWHKFHYFKNLDNFTTWFVRPFHGAAVRDGSQLFLYLSNKTYLKRFNAHNRRTVRFTVLTTDDGSFDSIEANQNFSHHITTSGRLSHPYTSFSLFLDNDYDISVTDGCKYVLSQRYSDKLQVYCSSDGVNFQTISPLILVKDGGSVWWNPFRRKMILLSRENAFMHLRMVRYWETGNISETSSYYSHCENKNYWLRKQSTQLGYGDVSARWQACDRPLGGNQAVWFCGSLPTDPPYDSEFDVPFFGDPDINWRVTDSYDMKSSSYESVMMFAREIHFGGRGHQELTAIDITFSRDGFHQTRYEHHIYPPEIGSRISCVLIPQSLTIQLGNWTDLFCGGNKIDVAKKWNALYRLRRDGWASLSPIQGGRADVWTVWMLMPGISSLFFNINIEQEGEFLPCLYVADHAKAAKFKDKLNSARQEFCAQSLTGPLDSTAFEIELPRPLGATIFRLRFQMWGPVNLYSFWFNETTVVQ